MYTYHMLWCEIAQSDARGLDPYDNPTYAWSDTSQIGETQATFGASVVSGDNECFCAMFVGVCCCLFASLSALT